MARMRAKRWLPWLRLIVMLVVAVYGLIAMKEILDFYDEASEVIGHGPERGPRRWVLGTVPLFAWWSLAILALELPVRQGTRILRRPGIVPGLVVILFAVRNMIESAALYFHWRGTAPLDLWGLARLAMPTPDKFQTISHSAGMVVASTWVALWIGGWWHPIASWNDRAGRALGWYWIVIGLIDPFYFSLV